MESRSAVSQISVLVLVAFFLSGSAAQSAYYSISLENRDANQFILSCRDKFGIAVRDAVFLRNGLIYSEDRMCLQKIASPPAEGRTNVSLKAECEGYYQCGVEINQQSSTYILSGPRPIFAYPVHTTTDNDLTVEVTEYDKATLLCPVEISALNSFKVTWNRFESGTFTSLTNEINPDYSMQLTNVTFRDSTAVFRCEVRSTPFSTERLGTILGPRITLTIFRKHIPPSFTRDLEFTLNTDDNYVFRVSSMGTYPLTFKWLANNKLLDSTEVETAPININKVIEELSQTVLAGTGFDDKENINLTVIVQNTDANTNEVFSISQTSFLFSKQRANSPPIPTAASASTMVVTTTTTNVGESQFENNKDFDIVVPALISVLFVSLAAVFALAVLVCRRYKGQRYNNTICNCAITEALHSSRKTYVTENSKQNPCTSIVLSPGVFPVSNGHPLSNGVVTSALSVSITPCPPPRNPDEWPNPVSAILYRVAILYWNAKPSDLTLMKSLQHVLADVLDDEEITSNYEAMKCLQQLRDDVTGFGDKLRENRYMRQYSRQATYVSNKSRPSITSSSEHQNLGTVEEEQRGPLITEVETTLHDENGIDEPDGGEEDAEEEQAIEKISNIAEMLNKWIEKARTRHGDASNHETRPAIVQEPDDTG